MRSDSFWVLRATSLVVIKSLAHFERLHLAAAVLAMPEALCVFLFSNYEINYGPDCPKLWA